jgi:hypothetical protein
MKKIEQIQGQALYLLESEGDMTTHQIASMAVPVCSDSAMAIALNQLKEEGEIKKKGLNWTLVSEANDADAA